MKVESPAYDYNSTKAQLTQCVIKWVLFGRTLYPRRFNRAIPTIEFTLKGTVAGTACHTTNTLNFNIQLAAENLDTFLNQIVPHEVAHLIADGLGSRGHDRIWKVIMRKFGVEPTVCHVMNTDSVKRQRDVTEITWTHDITLQKFTFKTRRQLIQQLYTICICEGYDTRWIYEQALQAGVKKSTVTTYIRSLVEHNSEQR
jgi:predicted SprT family Zn-dependent metalloprotease